MIGSNQKLSAFEKVATAYRQLLTLFYYQPDSSLV
jgi:hypothetical protein